MEMSLKSGKHFQCWVIMPLFANNKGDEAVVQLVVSYMHETLLLPDLYVSNALVENILV